jgi:lipopolysaccharide transport protein LptA
MIGTVYPVISAHSQEETAEPKDKPAGEPIRITADRLDSNPDEKYAEFIGNVKASQADFVITSKSLKIYYGGDLLNLEKQSSNENMLKKIVASGDVKVVSEQYTAKTDRLEYDFQAQVLELSGLDSTITMGKNSIAGSKITYNRAEERFKVEGGSDKRVNAVFFSDGKVSDMFGDEEEKEKPKE